MGELPGSDASAAARASDEVKELCRLADEHLAADRLAIAVGTYRRALELDPNYSRARHNLGVAYYKMGMFVPAAAELQRAIELAPGAPEYHFTLGLVHKDSRQWEEAIAEFDAALELDPGFVPALRYRAATQFERGDNAEAIRDFHGVLELSPEERGVAYDLAVAHADAHEWPEAREWFTRAADEEPSNADIYYNLGLAHARDINTPDSEAEAALRHALRIDPDHLEARFRLGIVHAKAKYRDPAARERAIEELEALAGRDDLAEVFPEAHLVHFALGTLYDDAPETSEQAEQCYEKCLALQPDLPAALNNWGVLARQGGRAVAAARAFTRAIAADPTYDNAYHNLCRLLYDAPDELARQELAGLAEAAPESAPTALLRVLLEMINIAKADAYRDSYQKVHEVKNLVAVLGARMRGIQQEARRGLEAEELAQRVDELMSAHERLFASLTEYLSVLQRKEPRFEIVNFSEVVEEALVETDGRRPEDVQTAISISRLLPELRGDKGQLVEALANLLYNAYEAMTGRAGAVEVRAEPLIADTAPARRRSLRGIRVTVGDSGRGMRREEMARIFRPGYTTKPDGSGYGLSVAANVVREHNGTIRVESEPGMGTSFIVELPLNLDVDKEQTRMRLRPVIFEDPRKLIRTELEEL
ncbi:MAG: tetratricopeptide repeat protein [Armatimonadota bacterium]